MRVYTVLRSSTGVSMGKVMRQNISQPEAPSTRAASYKCCGTFWSPAINSRIWMPDFQDRLKMLFITSPNISAIPRRQSEAQQEILGCARPEHDGGLLAPT